MIQIGRQQRHQRIREILSHNEIRSQEQLLDLLFAEEIQTTQATLSRDLRDLGAIKSPQGYSLANNGAREGVDDANVRRILKRDLLSAQRGGPLAVMHTRPGRAQVLTSEIESLHLPYVLGTIAGSDTLFVATQSSAQARQFVALVRRWAGLK